MYILKWSLAVVWKMNSRCTLQDKLEISCSSQKSVLDYSGDNGGGKDCINSGYILEFLLTEPDDNLCGKRQNGG